jgi:hypothetical protein
MPLTISIRTRPWPVDGSFGGAVSVMLLSDPVRIATSLDKNSVVALLKNAGAGDEYKSVGFDASTSAAHLERLFLQHMVPDAVCILACDGNIRKGCLLAMAYSHPFAQAKVAKETVWWIDKDARGRFAKPMMDFYENWARERGCSYVGISGLGENPRVGVLYKRRGYEVADTNYIKKI